MNIAEKSFRLRDDTLEGNKSTLSNFKLGLTYLTSEVSDIITVMYGLALLQVLYQPLVSLFGCMWYKRAGAYSNN